MANKSILLYFLLVAFIIVNLLSTHSFAEANDEMQVLIDFKAGLNDPDNLLAKWNENKGNQDPCKWDHVSCNENGSVIGLDLGDTKISGPISPGLGYLNSLQNLDLHNSSFNGSLPDTLGYPMFLRFIILNLLSAHSRAQLEIEILMDFKAGVDDPDNALANWNSEIEDPDPCEWFHVSCNHNQRVISLDLRDTRISGPISPRLSELTYLENLDLYRSSFNGTLPDSLGNLKFLKELDVSKNQLTGHIPSTFNKLSRLHIL
ncbi:disease resistance protein BAK6-like [Cryptomeria japonica]|uniref:disease resistance protein BAK6-like n=1 Tax=Cryptomeria japonica TaxID=3369 RepID=UPI0027D9D914|nr:disease resistance protein BAK6-like [Cryptomeria japonica]